MTARLRELVFNKESTDSIREQAKRDGMTALSEDALRKALSGLTSLEEVLRLTQREDLFS